MLLASTHEALKLANTRNETKYRNIKPQSGIHLLDTVNNDKELIFIFGHLVGLYLEYSKLVS